MVLESYNTFLLQNATRVSSIESSLRSLTYFLPGRFKDSELASEALYSLLNILGSYHDSILLQSISALPPPLRPTPSSHSRYTTYYTTTSPPYRYLSRTLSLITNLELLIEMGLKKKRGQKAADGSVLVLEGLKTVLRLCLMRVTKGRTGLQPPVPEREVDPSVLDLHRPHLVQEGEEVKVSFNKEGEDEGENTAVGGGEEHESYWKGSRTGYTRPTLASIRGETLPLSSTLLADHHHQSSATEAKETVSNYLQTRVLTVENAKRPQDLVRRAKGLGKLAEIIWILRPLIYVLAMRHYGRTHTLPYLLSLSLEYTSYSLRKQSLKKLTSTKSSGPMLPVSPESDAEQMETSRRKRLFWWYLVRGPVWEEWTKPQLEAISNRFNDTPVIGLVSTLIGDYMPLVDEYYFYTS